MTEDLLRFFGGVNSILTSIHRAMENVLIQILNANCAPKLIYGDEVKDHNAWEMNQSNDALNGAISNLRVLLLARHLTNSRLLRIKTNGSIN